MAFVISIGLARLLPIRIPASIPLSRVYKGAERMAGIRLFVP